MYKKSTLSIFSLAFLLGVFVFSCQPVQLNAQGISSFYMQAGVPQNQFAENLGGDLAFGFSMQHLRRIGEGPFSVGAGINFMGYGGDRWDEYWAFGENVYDAEYAIENCVMDYTALLRFEAPIAFRVRPYGEAFAGISSFQTSFTVTDAANLDDCNNTLYEETLSRDLAPIYGAGFGLLIPLCGDEMFLDLGASYRNSGRMDYMNDDFDQSFTSRTDMWMIRVGVTMNTF